MFNFFECRLVYFSHLLLLILPPYHFRSVLILDEVICISLVGLAEDGFVKLNQPSVKFEDTYMTMTRAETVTITNRSSVIVHFCWSKFATEEEEKQDKQK